MAWRDQAIGFLQAGAAHKLIVDPLAPTSPSVRTVSLCNINDGSTID